MKKTFCILVSILFFNCGNPVAQKLDYEYLRGQYSYFTHYKFKENVLSVSERYLYPSEYSLITDSFSVESFVDEKMNELDLNPFKEVTTFDVDGRIVYTTSPAGQDRKYEYDNNGYISTISLLGGKSKRLLYKTYFEYNQDFSRCISEEYKMKKIKNYQYGNGMAYQVVDSLNMYGPDTIGRLCRKHEYIMNPSGLKIMEMTYSDEKESKLERKTITELYQDNTLKIRYDIMKTRHVDRAWVTRTELDEDGKVLKLEEFYLKEKDHLEENFDLEKKNLNQIDLPDSNIFYLNKTETPFYDEDGNQLPVGGGFYKYLFDEQGNWYAEILCSSENENSIKVVRIRQIAYQK